MSETVREVVAGTIYSAPYPFVRDTFESWEGDPEPVIVPTWKPGVRFEPCGPEDSEAVADAHGRIVLTVVAVFKPGRYPTRVFYTRQWENPDGHRFGKGGLRIATLEKFRRLAGGYQHEYRLATQRAAA